jgi:ABC-type branched-subunit amino acid transport system substrate-binding protein
LLCCITSCSKNTIAQRIKKSDKELPVQVIPAPVPRQDTAQHVFPTDDVIVPSKRHKDTYKIALLLPLFLNEAKTENDSLETFQVKNKSVQGLDLYQGIKFAFDSLAHNTGINFQLNVLDTKQDDETVRMICLKPEFYDADLIIGPVYNNSLKVAATYAKKYEIPMVSPLSPAENLTVNNEYFFMANPGLSVHCKKLIHHIAGNYPNENVLLIHQKSDEETADVFRNIFLRSSHSIVKHDLLYTNGKYTDISGKIPATDLKSRLKSNGNNIIIAASLDLQFAHKLSRELFNLSDEYTFVVFGLPIWNPENDLRLDYLEKINTHFTLAFHLPDSSFYASTFAKKFEAVFKNFPNETGYKGFDIGYFFGKMLIEHGSNFQKHIETETFPANHTNFVFKKSYTDGSFEKEMQFLYFENKHVFLFRYDNFSLKQLK